MLKKLGIAIPSLIGLFVIGFLAGPKPNFSKVNPESVQLDLDLTALESYIATKESKVDYLKPENEAQLYWADTSHSVTPYSLLFLHGFSGTHHEANPLHKAFGRRYGMNTYLHRIIDHGITNERAFENLTPSELLYSAKEGMAIAKLIGEKVVIMGCSTGCTYAAYLANDPDISHLIFISPNIALYSSNTEMVTGPWGKQILEMITDGDIRRYPQSPDSAPYWQSEYHIDGIVAMQSLIDQTMTEEVFSRIKQPLYVGCYYKDEAHQDFSISVEAARNFFKATSTSESDKLFVEFSNAGNHVISSPIKAKNVGEVYRSIFDFGDRYFEVVNDSTLIY